MCTIADMSVVSTPSRKISWRERREVVNLLEVLATEQTKVGERLARLREAHALTQEAAAARAGVTLRAWQRWESGASEPYARNIARISEEFEIPLHELVGDGPSPEPSQLDRIEQKLDLILNQLQGQETDTAMEIHRAFEDMANRLGREVGKRPAQSRRKADRSPEAPPAAA
jgi:transcriptional regulator with XRE-family HTH domain